MPEMKMGVVSYLLGLCIWFVIEGCICMSFSKIVGAILLSFFIFLLLRWGWCLLHVPRDYYPDGTSVPVYPCHFFPF